MRSAVLTDLRPPAPSSVSLRYHVTMSRSSFRYGSDLSHLTYSWQYAGAFLLLLLCSPSLLPSARSRRRDLGLKGTQHDDRRWRSRSSSSSSSAYRTESRGTGGGSMPSTSRVWYSPSRECVGQDVSVGATEWTSSLHWGRGRGNRVSR